MKATGPQAAPDRILSVSVGSEAAGRRLDAYVAEVAGVSRSRAKRLVLEGRVTVDGQPAEPSHPVRAGQVVTVHVPPPEEPPEPVPEELPVSVLYEDEELAVVDKPAGLAVHPGAGRPRGTLVNALLGRLDRLSRLDPARPGIVHRLDKDTSGLLVVAKTEEAHRSLSAQIAARTAQRWYWALLRGDVPWEEQTVSAPIARHPVHRQRMAVVAGGREATTCFRVVERFPGYALVECRLLTGRTHQIRVHARHIGYPVAGDPTYGRRGELGLARQFLHAWRLAFTHPKTGAPMEFTSPLPADLQQVLDVLRRNAGTCVTAGPERARSTAGPGRGRG